MAVTRRAAHDVILRPVVSEKSYANSDRGQYTFVVADNANKVEIKQAIEEIFKAKAKPGAPAQVSDAGLRRSARSLLLLRARRSISSVTKG